MIEAIQRKPAQTPHSVVEVVQPEVIKNEPLIQHLEPLKES